MSDASANSAMSNALDMVFVSRRAPPKPTMADATKAAEEMLAAFRRGESSMDYGCNKTIITGGDFKTVIQTKAGTCLVSHSNDQTGKADQDAKAVPVSTAIEAAATGVGSVSAAAAAGASNVAPGSAIGTVGPTATTVSVEALKAGSAGLAAAAAAASAITATTGPTAMAGSAHVHDVYSLSTGFGSEPTPAALAKQLETVNPNARVINVNRAFHANETVRTHARALERVLSLFVTQQTGRSATSIVKELSNVLDVVKALSGSVGEEKRLEFYITKSASTALAARYFADQKTDTTSGTAAGASNSSSLMTLSHEDMQSLAKVAKGKEAYNMFLEDNVRTMIGDKVYFAGREPLKYVVVRKECSERDIIIDGIDMACVLNEFDSKFVALCNEANVECLVA